MASPFTPKIISDRGLNQKSLTEMIKENFDTLTDVRTGDNTQYKVSDAALSAFAVFFMQNPSFLSQQISLQKTQGKNNLQTLFGAYSNPCDNHIRNLLDKVYPTVRRQLPVLPHLKIILP